MNLRQAAEMALYALDRSRFAFENFTQEINALRAALAEADDRKCTCHPDDNPPQPCPKQFALGECRQAAALAEAKEPVAWLQKNGFRFLEAAEPQDDSELPLYTHPPSPEPTALANSGYKELKEAFANLLEDYEAMKTPLTDEEIDAITRDRWGTQLLGVMVQTHREYARAIERAHGIGTDE